MVKRSVSVGNLDSTLDEGSSTPMGTFSFLVEKLTLFINQS